MKEEFTQVSEDETYFNQGQTGEVRNDLTEYASQLIRPYVYKSLDKSGEGGSYRCGACSAYMKCKTNVITHALSHLNYENSKAAKELKVYCRANSKRININCHHCNFCNKDIKCMFSKIVIHILNAHVLDWNVILENKEQI